MHILVDGYNVTKADPATRDLSLEEQRARLIARLRVSGREILGRGSITVVFDGQPGVGTTDDAGSVTVRYTSGRTADELITELAATAREQIILVTDDRGLRDHVQAAATHSAEYRDRSTLFEGAPRRGAARQKASRKGVSRDAGLPVLPHWRNTLRKLFEAGLAVYALVLCFGVGCALAGAILQASKHVQDPTTIDFQSLFSAL